VNARRNVGLEVAHKSQKSVGRKSGLGQKSEAVSSRAESRGKREGETGRQGGATVGAVDAEASDEDRDKDDEADGDVEEEEEVADAGTERKGPK